MSPACRLNTRSGPRGHARARPSHELRRGHRARRLPSVGGPRPAALARRRRDGYRGPVTIAERLLADERPRVVLPGVGGALRAYLAAELVLADRTPILVGRSAEDAEALHHDLCFFLGLDAERAADRGVLYLGADDKSPYEEYSPEANAVMERIGALHRLARAPDEVKAVVLSPRTLARRLVPPDFFGRFGEYVLRGEEIDRQHLVDRLARSGYNRVSTVEDPGTFSVRGGIVDVFSPHASRPVRIDLFGDEVDTLHHFDPATQRNLYDIEDAVILPAREIAFDPETRRRVAEAVEDLAEQHLVPSRRVNAVLDDLENEIHFFGIEALLPLFHPDGLVGVDAYLPSGPGAVYLLDDPERIAEASDGLWAEAQHEYERALAHHHLVLPPEAHLAEGAEVIARATKEARAVITPEVSVGDDEPTVRLRYETVEQLRGEILRATRSRSDDDDVLAPLTARLDQWRNDGQTTLLVCHTRGQAERLKQMLDDRGVPARRLDAPFSLERWQDAMDPAEARQRRQTTLRDPSVKAWLAIGEITAGFVLPAAGLAFVSEEEIFGSRLRSRKRRKPAAGEFVSDLADLGGGDFVVHVDYGVGKYHGLTRLTVDGVEGDYLHIEYKGDDKLYLPVSRLKLIQKYVGAQEGRAPPLDKLGGTSWITTKQKVKDNLLSMAAELLRLYAKREAVEGYAFPPPDETYRQFEAEFEHEPTPDQARAIEDVIADVQKSSPMDRLICGDVGYGKTEVAMRATMMAVVAGKQTAVLVPTTVLAAQHFSVFSKRFDNFGVNVGLVSRFQSSKEIKETLTKASEGKVDILVGTHRLLGKDVKFRDLGLLVIDEEHRFGVSHKEKLKRYRSMVHVLAMSATPIPRSLHMGFMGVRDMSMIATPPEDRLAVKTEVHRFGEEVLRDAVVREIKRGGQAFVVHNRVSSIEAFGRMLERLVPEARIAIGHGQMDQDRLEKIMVDFMNREFNVLLSTTIIESGIDIQNANTMIVNRADQMGLAQLYQLKGRVGRGKARGYCYFLIPAGNLSPKARKRIAVLQRFTELGAGFKVASKDMEIRGAGNLLGKQQSGNITKVGFDMYQALLQEAIAELKGKAASDVREPEIRLPTPALIPDGYIPEAGDRLGFYRRFNDADTDEATYDLLQEIGDLYGHPPAEVENLTALMLVKQRCFRLGVASLDFGPETKSMPPRLVLAFDSDHAPQPDRVVAFVQAEPKRRKLVPDGRLMLFLEPYEDQREILEQARLLLDGMLAEVAPPASGRASTG